MHMTSNNNNDSNNNMAIVDDLGFLNAEQAAALLTSTLIASDLYRASASATEWGVAALSVSWFTDELLENAVAITLGKDILA